MTKELDSSRGDHLRSESSRAVSIRYFNLYRIVLASVFAIFGSVFQFGNTAPGTFQALVAVYWSLAIAFAILPMRRVESSNMLLGIQVTVDIWVLTIFMYLSGGPSSGIPYLLMTTIAGAGLISEGRMVLGVAAMATIAVLFEQFLRVITGEEGVGDFTRTGITCVGYFAIASIARLLARRALANEQLARARGADLERQRRVNAYVIEDMLDGVVVIDDKGIVRQCNPAATELLGITLHQGELLEASSPELARMASLSALDLPDIEAMGQDARVFRAVVSGRNLRLRRVGTGEGGDQVLYLEDMDRIQAQAQQIKLAALGRLTANIAHEIRNPLSAVTHAADLLAEEKRADMQQRLLHIVRDNAARIERIIKDVLELGRRDRATVELLDLQMFLRAFMDEFIVHSPAAQHVLRIEVNREQRGELRVQFDRMHLHQVLNNLVSNAIRYCRGEAGSVCLTADELEDGRVSIVVSDDGPGVAEVDRVKIFEPFFTSDPKGSGLGLYIARELAEANGAQLMLADTEAGAYKGANFQLLARGVA